MKKNLKIVSLAAAALLAVAPVVSSTVPVNAADTPVSVGTSAGNTASSNTTTTQTPVNKPYFTFQGNVVGESTKDNPNGNVVPTTVTIKDGETVRTFIDDVTKQVLFHDTNSSAGNNLSLKGQDVIDALRKSGATVEQDKKNKNVWTITKAPTNSFNFTLTGASGSQTATVQIPVVPATNPNPNPVDTDAPVIKVNGGKYSNTDLDGQVFQVAQGSQFNPTNFTDSDGNQITISAQQTEHNATNASLDATNNHVDTSAAGRFYTVTLTATGLTGKKTTRSYLVLITSSHRMPLYTNGADAIPTYRIYGNNVLNNGKTFKNGDTVYVANGTKIINKISYSQVSTKSKKDAGHSNIWVQTSALTKPATTQEAGQVKMVMHDSEAYDANGKALGHVYANYTNITIIPKVVTINGKTYYKVANKDEYVRVTNITGTARVLRHNAYVYRSSYRRADSRKLYKGSTVITYGGSYRFKNGKRYWRIGGPSKQYVKCANF